MHQKILIVEDEERLAQLMSEYLKKEGYQNYWINNGLEVVDWIKKNHPNMILLDLMLPGKDGLTICKEIRRFSQVPIIMITAKVEEIDRLLGLEIGADDYVCKPFSYREVIARVKALFRRSNVLKTVSLNDSQLKIDESTLLLTFKNSQVELTAIEFRLLKRLMASPGQIFSRNQLMDCIYSDQRIVNDRTIDSHIKKLRKKIAVILPGQEIVQSVYGVGYKYYSDS